MNELTDGRALAVARTALTNPFGVADAVLPSWQISASRAAALTELEWRVHRALSTYSNIHRGSGHHSAVTSALYERARHVVLEYLQLDAAEYVVIFLSPHGARLLTSNIEPSRFHLLSSQAIGLPLGVRALAIHRRALPRGRPVQTGGGTAKIVSPNSAIWEDVPARFEAGTPAIPNVIAFACALRIVRRCGLRVFQAVEGEATEVEKVSTEGAFASLSGEALLAALRETLIGRDVEVPTELGARRFVHLDNAASTPTFAPVWNSVCQAWRLSEVGRSWLPQDVRRTCADYFGANREEYAVIFTANTTEAINVVASSLGAREDDGVTHVVLNTWLEHNSNELPWRAVCSDVLRVSVDEQGFVDLDELERLLKAYNRDASFGRKRITLVSVSGASNVLGTYNDLAAISRVAHRFGASVLVDAAQLAAHRKIEMEKWGIDYLAISGHKVYAPFGSGVLIGRRSLLRRTRAIWESVNESGEENSVGIAALGKALSLLHRVGLDVIESEERRLTERLLEGLSTVPGVEIWGVRETRHSRSRQRGGIVSFHAKHVPHNSLAQELADRGGIGIRTGCHCAHLLVKRLFGVHPLQAKAPDLLMLLFPTFANAALAGLPRVSLGIGNDDEDVDHFLSVLRLICDAPRSRTDRFFAANRGGTPFLPASSVRGAMDATIDNAIKDVYGAWHDHAAL